MNFRLRRSQGKALASRLPRPLWLFLIPLMAFLSTVIANVRHARQPRLRRLHEGTFSRLELGFYHVVVVPLIAFLPAPLAYRLACLQGDLRYYLDKTKRQYMLEGLEGVMGEQMSLAERIQTVRGFFRIKACEAVDAMRLTGKGRALKQLVEIRGLEHVEAALAAGKGAVLCGAHFGSYITCWALIGACGYPITAVGRIPSKFNKNRTLMERLIFRQIFLKPLASHMHGSYIEPRGQYEVSLQVAKVLRKNEVLGIAIDPPVLPVDRARAVPVDFLNGQALLVPGITTVAKLMGTPVLMTFMRRSPDWRHQILEISPPVSMEGDDVTSFRRCLAAVEDAIRQNPSHWHYWGKYALMDLGLLLKEPVGKGLEGQEM